MSFPSPPFVEPVTCKELAYYLRLRTPRWVASECRAGRIETLPVGRPYLIPADEANRILATKNEHHDDDSRTTASAR